MLLLRYQGSSVSTEVTHDLEISHDKGLNILQLQIINSDDPVDFVPFDIDVDEIDEFITFIKDAAQNMKDIDQSEEGI